MDAWTIGEMAIFGLRVGEISQAAQVLWTEHLLGSSLTRSDILVEKNNSISRPQINILYMFNISNKGIDSIRINAENSAKPRLRESPRTKETGRREDRNKWGGATHPEEYVKQSHIYKRKT